MRAGAASERPGEPMDDTRWMARALALAARGRGLTSPNPMVGAVVARAGEVIAAGYHAYAGAAHAEVSALAAAMLPLTLHTSPAVAREVADRLNGLATQDFPPRAAQSAQALLAHGRLLLDLLPTTDGVLRALLAAPSKQELQTLRAMVLTRQAASRTTARESRRAGRRS